MRSTHDTRTENERRLAAAVRALRGSPRPRPAADDLAAQLAYLERSIEEMRTRVNALFFAVLTAVLGQFIANFLTRLLV